MFTGLIDHSGRVASVEENADGARIEIATELAPTLKLGDSVAINGACMTVATLTEESFTADVMHESLRRTSLGALSDGDRVNLELPLAVGDRLDGHIVQGHVDGVGEVVQIREDGFSRILRVKTPGDLSKYVVEKGSITIDGVSLTVSDVGDDFLEVSLIPETQERTNLGSKQTGEHVNLEADILAKHVERLLTLPNSPEQRQ
jgi:riboflavin synthase